MITLFDSNTWMHAYLAAFAMLQDTEFFTLDRDFRNFEEEGLKLRLLTL